uniref:Uncharacterized protein n=1 Tax=Siphoviridae sp. ctnPP24 TaxID=2825662 RepID=A0A8S5TZ81_9CAUD|nr:MAG TPA: hypothetical protein [Siphoviridae sp. ctnPP24]
MAILFETETAKKLTSQDMYDIIHFAAQSAEDNGFVNQFVFERALYAYAAIILYPDRKEELGRIVSDNILDAWDALLTDGTIADMNENFAVDMDALGRIGSVWLDDYIKYLQSARGILSSFQEFSGDIIQTAVEKFKTVSDEVGANQVLEIANNWGMNNNPEKEVQAIANKEKPKFEIVGESEKVVDNVLEPKISEPEETEESLEEDGPLFKL